MKPATNQIAVLYSFWHSSCTRRVRTVLNLKGIPYETVPVNINKGEQFLEDFKKVNPMAHVPALRIDGITLIESLNIMTYLEETRPQVPLVPSDIIKRAKVREICEVISSGIQPLQNTTILKYLGREKGAEFAQIAVKDGFEAVEKILEETAGKYCVGDEITFADCCLVPQIFNAREFGVDLTLFKIICRIDKELESHPAFIHSHPYNQPDTPSKYKK